ncbi:MAG: metallophosphoesterase [Minisyncoccota bacterium]
MSNRSRVVFLFIVIGILSLGTFVVYEGLALAFHTEGTALAIALGFLTLSFVASTILGNYYYNAFTRAYYLLSAVWIGFFTYAFLISILFALVVAVSASLVPIGSVLYGITLLVSMYGVLHARILVTKEVTIILPQLPSSWKGRKAVWISDVHFGQIYGSPHAEKIATHIETIAPDIIFVGGDLFDGTGAPDVQKQVAPFARLSAPFGVYFITGNHEEYGDLGTFLSAVEKAGMRILKDELIELDGLQLIGVDYQSTSSTLGFEKVLSKLKINRDRPSILLKHGPEDLHVANAAGISLQISGHTHNGQMWPLGFVAAMVHNGFSYGLKSFKNIQIFTSSGAGTWGPPMRVGTDSEIVLCTFK